MNRNLRAGGLADINEKRKAAEQGYILLNRFFSREQLLSYHGWDAIQSAIARYFGAFAAGCPVNCLAPQAPPVDQVPAFV